MTAITFFAVLLAALLHAIWNALIKVSGDRLAIMAVITTYTSLLVVPVLFLLPLPDQASWPYLGASAVIHGGYMLLLVTAYGHGDFSQIYPVARGSAPLLTTVLGFLLLGEAVTGITFLGMLLIVGGIIAFSLERPLQGRQRISAIGLGLSLSVGFMITSYSLVDGVGARLSGTAVGFTAWTFFLDGFIVSGFAFLRRRHQLKTTIIKVWKPALLVAFLSVVAYSLVVWSFTQSPIGLVATLRETSVLFAVLISALLIRERFSPYRLLMSAVIVSGVIIIGLDSI